jgi:hypothetical protein
MASATVSRILSAIAATALLSLTLHLAYPPATANSTRVAATNLAKPDADTQPTATYNEDL